MLNASLVPTVQPDTLRTRALNQPGKRKARILVVDDDPGLLRLLTIRLRAESYDVEAVESGIQALAAASRFRPDLVITDLRMDHMDGIGLLKELQNRWPGLKVIILTAHGTIPDAVQATQMGAFGFLTKPVDKQELLDQLDRDDGCLRQSHVLANYVLQLSDVARPIGRGEELHSFRRVDLADAAFLRNLCEEVSDE